MNELIKAKEKLAEYRLRTAALLLVTFSLFWGFTETDKGDTACLVAMLGFFVFAYMTARSYDLVGSKAIEVSHLRAKERAREMLKEMVTTVGDRTWVGADLVVAREYDINDGNVHFVCWNPEGAWCVVTAHFSIHQKLIRLTLEPISEKCGEHMAAGGRLSF